MYGNQLRKVVSVWPLDDTLSHVENSLLLGRRDTPHQNHLAQPCRADRHVGPITPGSSAKELVVRCLFPAANRTNLVADPTPVDANLERG